MGIWVCPQRLRWVEKFRGAWQVIVHRVSKTWTQLKWLSSRGGSSLWVKQWVCEVSPVSPFRYTRDTAWESLLCFVVENWHEMCWTLLGVSILTPNAQSSPPGVPGNTSPHPSPPLATAKLHRHDTQPLSEFPKPTCLSTLVLDFSLLVYVW